MTRRNFWLVAPYAAWMLLMCALPSTAWAYAVRGAVTAVLLAVSAVRLGAYPEAFRLRAVAPALLPGVVAGLVVFAVWIAPEYIFAATGSAKSEASAYSPETCGAALTVVKLAASALVIPAAEELFFRRWLVDFAGFWWMVVLFAVEHGDRWHVGAIAGVVYGLVAKRSGLAAAVVAHSVTNLVLGLYVVFGDKWMYW